MVFKGYDDLAQGSLLVQSDVQTSAKGSGVLAQFDSVFHGLTIACSDATLDRLAALPGVLAIVPDAIISLDETQTLAEVRAGSGVVGGEERGLWGTRGFVVVVGGGGGWGG